MKTFGLIGYPLSHSFSQQYFIEKFERENITDCEFKNFPLENINDFPVLLKNNPSLCGLSVTIPHKQSVRRFLDDVDDVARKVGAVNCIKINRKSENGKWKLLGFNTDVYGFEKSLVPLLKTHHERALILGTGGAAQAVARALINLNIDFLFLTRENHPKQLNRHSYSLVHDGYLMEHLIIINATPAGMFPNSNECPPIPYEYLTPQHLLYDLVYNPEETLFLRKGKEKGVLTKNGLEMLQLQAEKAWEIWNS
ncbi:MAG TPA: shikimate dehydrogenase [Bacteroidia bacterium]|nr:shikimate dehydrogenase [Bacteroidia bacterium]